MLKEAPVILEVTETSVKISLKEALDQISSEELEHFFKHVNVYISEVYLILKVTIDVQLAI
jgi:hypothetical protein